MRFTCPTCNQLVQTADGTAGEVIGCPTCGQRLRVPGEASARPAPVDRTMDARIQTEADAGPRGGPASGASEPPPAEAPSRRRASRDDWDDGPARRRRRDRYEDDYDDYDDRYARPRRPEVNTGLAVAGLVCGIVAVVTFWCVFVGPLCAALALIFSGIHLSNKVEEGNGMAIAGLCTGAAALLLFLLILIIAITSNNSVFWFRRM